MPTIPPESLALMLDAKNRGDAIAYYSIVAQYGQEYGNLALEMVTDTSFRGIYGNNFMETKLPEFGQTWSPQLRDTLIVELMVADWSYRQNGEAVPAETIKLYHYEKLADHGLPEEAWPAT